MLLQPCSSDVVPVNTSAVGLAGLRAGDKYGEPFWKPKSRETPVSQGLTGGVNNGESQRSIKWRTIIFEFTSHPGIGEEPENVDRLAFFQKGHHESSMRQAGIARQ